MNEKTGTRIYGQSDDNIYCDGEYEGQYSSYDSAEDGILLVVSDGTLLEVKYGKGDLSIWGITVIKKGELLRSRFVMIRAQTSIRMWLVSSPAFNISMLVANGPR